MQAGEGVPPGVSAGPGAPAARQPEQQDVPGQGVPGVLAEEDCQGGGRVGGGRHPQLPGTWHQQGSHGGQDIGGRAAELDGNSIMASIGPDPC